MPRAGRHHAHYHTGALTSLLLVAALSASACAPNSQSSEDSGGSGGDAATVQITLTPQGCKPDPATMDAGSLTFAIRNENAGGVTEAELMRDGVILGERENLTPGLSNSFTLRVKPGAYSIYCPGAEQEEWDFTVENGGQSSPSSSRAPRLQAAVAQYRSYVQQQADALVEATKQFTAAVANGDIDAAKSQYAPARRYYERIEPVAESFGELDPAIDARINDVADRSEWSGFHRIERALWSDNAATAVKKMKPVADQLLEDVRTLRSKIGEATYQPAQLANGAVSLLDEVAKTKITGEEERYSHTDAYDIAANVAGARKAFELLKPALQQRKPDLARTLTTRFEQVEEALAPLREGEGFVDYTKVSQDRRRTLSRSIDALAEPLSRVAVVVA